LRLQNPGAKVGWSRWAISPCCRCSFGMPPNLREAGRSSGTHKSLGPQNSPALISAVAWSQDGPGAVAARRPGPQVRRPRDPPRACRPAGSAIAVSARPAAPSPQPLCTPTPPPSSPVPPLRTAPPRAAPRAGRTLGSVGAEPTPPAFAPQRPCTRTSSPSRLRGPRRRRPATAAAASSNCSEGSAKLSPRAGGPQCCSRESRSR
jgi:hypothetical protein